MFWPKQEDQWQASGLFEGQIASASLQGFGKVHTVCGRKVESVQLNLDDFFGDQDRDFEENDISLDAQAPLHQQAGENLILQVIISG